MNHYLRRYMGLAVQARTGVYDLPVGKEHPLSIFFGYQLFGMTILSLDATLADGSFAGIRMFTEPDTEDKATRFRTLDVPYSYTRTMDGALWGDPPTRDAGVTYLDVTSSNGLINADCCGEHYDLYKEEDASLIPYILDCSEDAVTSVMLLSRHLKEDQRVNHGRHNG